MMAELMSNTERSAFFTSLFSHIVQLTAIIYQFILLFIDIEIDIFIIIYP